MNFISHFYLDREQEDSYFFIGVSTPDLVSVFDRNIRVKEHRMPPLPGYTPESAGFYAGVMRHFQVDKMFHSSPFFTRETGRISAMIQERFRPEELSRVFFVAHVLLELTLDKILIQRDPKLLPDFYRHLERASLDNVVSLTEWITHTGMPGYLPFLNRFVRRKTLYQYTDWQSVVYILRRMMQGVGVAEVEYLHSPRFDQLLRSYEAELSAHCFEAFDDFKRTLGPA
ncbi:MAG: hypothetical protein EAZ89_02330 [Bacteroidetes bacterium]|nr:MAG: hypothetical protein EAZ89_02330 [Bacteroidota bacterium]